jgi:hypothetical protein
MPSACTTCAAYGDCHGGCRAVQEFRIDKRDPLRGEPLLAYQPTPQTIEIPAYGKPQFTGQIRAESFGYVVLGHSSVIPITNSANAVVSACDGQSTFLNLAEQFGNDALNLLGEMWQSGLLDVQ